MLSSITKLSPAKINLYLEVKGIRNDGYHNIESLMTFCDFGDIISVSKAERFKLILEGPFSDFLINKDNLIQKSLEKLEDHYRRDFKVEVVLKKNLPIASGMAGGSSNAATFILCVKEIFGLKISSGFNELLLSLGADVPFCYYRKTALVRGIGENIKFIGKLKEYFILLINPMFEVSTEEMFKGLRFDKNKITHQKEKLSNVLNEKIFINKSNDLEFCAVKKYKIIGEILSCLSNYKGAVLSRMSGSGATCFALFENNNDLDKAKILAKNNFKDCWIKSARLMNNVRDI